MAHNVRSACKVKLLNTIIIFIEYLIIFIEAFAKSRQIICNKNVYVSALMIIEQVIGNHTHLCFHGFNINKINTKVISI
jgi:hypothetical protein